MVFIMIILLNLIQKALLALRSIHYAKSFSVGNKMLAFCEHEQKLFCEIWCTVLYFLTNKIKPHMKLFLWNQKPCMLSVGHLFYY